MTTSAAPIKPNSAAFDDERTHPETPDRATFQHHLARYEFALAQMRPGERVLETGCGVGYGTHFLARKARFVLGIDYSPPAIQYAAARYRAPNLAFAVMNCHRMALPDAAFDRIISFEMYEHLERPLDYLQECARLLRPGGELLLSTPNRATWEIHMRSIEARYDFHINLVDLHQLRSQLSSSFGKLRIYGQRRRGSRLYSLLRSLDVWNLRLRLLPPAQREKLQREFDVPPGERASGEDWVFSRTQLRQCNHFVAVCRR
jgi:2-polyprenyl-3-methyl-5-hydroxy-6-metoxy-1,4-benzoquinol methylase